VEVKSEERGRTSGGTITRRGEIRWNKSNGRSQPKAVTTETTRLDITTEARENKRLGIKSSTQLLKKIGNAEKRAKTPANDNGKGEKGPEEKMQRRVKQR